MANVLLSKSDLVFFLQGTHLLWQLIYFLFPINFSHKLCFWSIATKIQTRMFFFALLIKYPKLYSRFINVVHEGDCRGYKSGTCIPFGFTVRGLLKGGTTSYQYILTAGSFAFGHLICDPRSQKFWKEDPHTPLGRGCFIWGSFNKHVHTPPSSALCAFRLFGQNPFWSLIMKSPLSPCFAKAMRSIKIRPNP